MATRTSKAATTTAAVTKTAVKVSKFESQLIRGNKEIRADRGRRISESVSDAQLKLIMDIKSDIRKKEDELARMTDLSTDNHNTSMNVISPSFDADAFVRKINELQLDLEKLRIKQRVAEETQQEWF